MASTAASTVDAVHGGRKVRHLDAKPHESTANVLRLLPRVQDDQCLAMLAGLLHQPIPPPFPVSEECQVVANSLERSEESRDVSYDFPDLPVVESARKAS